MANTQRDSQYVIWKQFLFWYFVSLVSKGNLNVYSEASCYDFRYAVNVSDQF